LIAAQIVLLGQALVACVTPCVFVNQTLYVGLFDWEHQEPCPEVRYDRLRGAGLELGWLRIGVGWFAFEMTTAEVTGTRPYFAATPLAVIRFEGTAPPDGACREIDP
jgi:hypothetical protein